MGTTSRGVDPNEANMFSDLGVVGQQQQQQQEEHVEHVEEKEDVASVLRSVMKDSVVPLIQRVMLKIDALDAKVKQMQLAVEEMEKDGRERDVWVKEGLEDVKGQLESIRSAVSVEETKKEESEVETESESEPEPETAGLDIEELQALLNQKLEMEKQRKKKGKKSMEAYGDGMGNGGRYHHHHHHHQGGGVPPPPPLGHSLSRSSSHGMPPPPPPPSGLPTVHSGGSSISSGGPPAPPHHAPQQPAPPARPPPPPMTYGVPHNATQYTAQPVVGGSYANAQAYQPPEYQPLHPPPQQQAPSSTGSVPIEKVIDDISIMGFSREEVRNVLRELTAQGKPVDMNIVLDRLGAR